MKLTITTTKEVDVKLPMYICSPLKTHYYAILSETDIVSVSSFSIQKTTKEVAFHGGYEVITKDEFQAKYNSVMEGLNRQWEGFKTFISELDNDEDDNYSSNEEEGQ